MSVLPLQSDVSLRAVLLFVLFRLVENEMTDDAAPRLADMIQANTGLTHLW